MFTFFFLNALFYFLGLLFTNCQYIVTLPTFEFKVVSDIKNERYNFSDGCGLISFKLAHEIWQEDKVLKKKWKSLPSVWQIRYCGYGSICKGILVVDYSTEGRTKNRISMRRSLLKENISITASETLSGMLGIVGVSQRKVGSLNKQIVALLSPNVPTEVLLDLQEEYLQRIKKAHCDPESAAHCFALKCDLLTYTQLVRLNSFMPPPFASLPSRIQNISDEKFKLPLSCSRLLFGAVLNKLGLKEGECIVLTEFGFHEGPVIVSRSPSYSPGDIRVLNCVTRPINHPVAQLRNIILFSTSGDRPDPDKMSGGDLDGDMYLVIWEESLLRYAKEVECERAQNYEAPTLDKDDSSKEDWITYLAQWDNIMLGKINNCFFNSAAASKEGVKSSDCEQLCELFSRAVDQHPSDLHKLQQLIAKCPNNSQEGNSLFFKREGEIPIWERMKEKQIQTVLEIKRNSDSLLSEHNWKSFYDKLICRDELDVRTILSHHNFQEICSKKEIDKLRSLWTKLCKGRKTETLSRTVSRIITELCKFDCTINDCDKIHPDVDSYRTEWIEKMQNEMDIFIAPFRSKMKHYKETIEHQDSLMKKELDLYDKEMTKHKIQCKKVDDLNKQIDRILLNMEETKRIDEHLEMLEKKASPNLLKRFSNWLANIFNLKIKLSAEETELLGKLQNEEKSLLEILEKSFQCKNHLSLSFLDVCDQPACQPHLKLRDERRLFMEELISFAYHCKMDKQMKITLNAVLPGHLFGRLTLSIEITKSKIKTMYMEQADVKEDLVRKKRSIEDYRCSLESIYNEINALVASSETGDFEDICPYIDVLLKKQEAEKGMVNELEEQRKDMLSSIETRKKDIHRRANELRRIKHSLDTAYDSKAKSDAESKLENILDEAGSFELSQSAVLYEVIRRLEDLTEWESDKQRISYTVELDMCLKREKNRCRKEKSAKNLPVFSKRSVLLKMLQNNDAIIVVANTGSGKSTQIPQYLADDLHHVMGTIDRKFAKIACTQPRRIAATRIAQRVSEEYAGAVEEPEQDSSDASEKNVCALEESQKTSSGDKVISENVSNVQVVAYPLYAALDHKEQERALDISDRTGSHNPKPCKSTNRVNSSRENPRKYIEGTPGEVGGWVGYQVGSTGKSGDAKKQCKKLNDETRIEFVTEGLLLAKLRSSIDSLNKYQCIVVDEAHERGKDTDLLMAHLRKIVKNQCCSLKVVIMSASINAQAFSAYFHGCPVIECDGRMYEVEEFYFPIVEKRFSSSFDLSSDSESDGNDNKEVNPLVRHAVTVLFTEIVPCDNDGDVLIFLAGKREIHSCIDLIRQLADERFVESQSPRKVVCCTNIAETSLTIPGVRFVIDTGKAKKITYDHKIRVTSLKLQDSTQAAAKQRKGRAGRLASGKCYRLYSEDHFFNMSAFDEPEMKNTPLDELYLYTLSIFGRLEDAELMEDAQLDVIAIRYAVERLLNLQFVQEISGDTKNVELTKHGKFALDISRYVSLESAKMIIAARKEDIDIRTDTIKLAVILQVASDFFTCKNEGKILKQRVPLINEFGDHLTMLDIYKKFEGFCLCSSKIKKRKESTARKWCDDIGVCFTVLQSIPNSLEQVNEVVKRSKMFGIQDKSDLDSNTREEKLLKLILAGYFHNIAEMHDIDYIKSGYSVLTPTTHDDKNHLPERITSANVNLLKVKLSRDSFVFESGDVVDNTYVIYVNLYQSSFTGCLFMKVISRVKPEWILEMTGHRWQQSLGLTFDSSYSSLKQIETFVKEAKRTNVGPEILAQLVKCESSKGVRLINSVEKESNVAICIIFDKAEIRWHGSEKEIRDGWEKINCFVNKKIEEFKEGDKVMYPFRKGNQICTIHSGLMVELNFQNIIATPIYDWDEIATGMLIFFDVGEDIVKTKIESIKMNAHETLRKELEETNVVYSGTSFVKVSFKSQKVAKYVKDRIYLCKCFLDSEIKINVIDSDLYPSVANEGYSHIIVKKYRHYFTLRKKKKSDGRLFKLEIDETLRKFIKRRLFSCTKVVSNFNLANENTTFVKKQMELWKKSTEDEFERSSFKIFICMQQKPFFEVYGEEEVQINVGGRLQEQILSFSGKSTVYHCREISLQRNKLKVIVENIERLRKDNENVTFDVYHAANHVIRSDKVTPMLKLLSTSTKDVKCAEKLVKKLLSDTDNIELQPRYSCVMCEKEVTVFVSKKKNNLIEEKGGKKGPIKIDKGLEEISRLTVCGCIYCSVCFYAVISQQLQVYGLVKCVVCTNEVLARDIERNLSWEVKNVIFKQAVCNKLSLQAKKMNAAVSECPRCAIPTIWYHENEYGVFRCRGNECLSLFCLGCGVRIMNGVEFEAHRNLCPKY